MNRFEYYDFLQAYKNKENTLQHYGIPGQKWHIRRFQNEDGTLTEEGKKRYGKYYDEESKLTEQGRHDINRKETYYNNRSESDRHKVENDFLSAALKAVGSAALALYDMKYGINIALGFNPIYLAGSTIAMSLIKAGYHAIDAKICEKRANQYYDLLKNSK